MVLFVWLLNSFASFVEPHCCLFFHSTIVKLMQYQLTSNHFDYFRIMHIFLKIKNPFLKSSVIVYRRAIVSTTKRIKSHTNVLLSQVATNRGTNFNYSAYLVIVISLIFPRTYRFMMYSTAIIVCGL